MAELRSLIALHAAVLCMGHICLGRVALRRAQVAVEAPPSIKELEVGVDVRPAVRVAAAQGTHLPKVNNLQSPQAASPQDDFRYPAKLEHKISSQCARCCKEKLLMPLRDAVGVHEVSQLRLPESGAASIQPQHAHSGLSGSA